MHVIILGKGGGAALLVLLLYNVLEALDVITVRQIAAKMVNGVLKNFEMVLKNFKSCCHV